jgi:hypothetical protein
MQIIGLIVGAMVFVVYFCLKYTYVARAKGYSATISIRDVWKFSFKGHSHRRNVVPIKYIGIVFVCTGLFGWGSNLSDKDLTNLWKPFAVLAIYLNSWARSAIYETTHWAQGVDKSISAFGMMRKSIQEIGWFPQEKDWLSRTVLVTGVLAVLLPLGRLYFSFV